MKNSNKGISLIVLIITIIVIVILATAILVSVINNNPISEANKARYESDRDNMQAVFTNTVGKIMAENQGVVNVTAGQINTVTKDAKEATGTVAYTVDNATVAANASGTIVFDKDANTATTYYTGKKLPIYAAGETKWYVDSEGVISLEVAGVKYGNGEVEETLVPGIKSKDGTINMSWQEVLDNGYLYLSDDGTLQTTDNPLYEPSVDLTLDKSVKKIDGWTFSGFQIDTLTIPTSVSKINCAMMEGLSYKTKVIYEGIVEEWKSIIIEDESNSYSYLIPPRNETYDYTYDDTVTIYCKNETITYNRVGEIVDNDMDEIALLSLAPGLYDENNNLMISWEDLTSTEYHEINYEDVVTEEQKSGAIININNGVLTTNPNGDENHSSDFLNGKLVIGDNVTSLGTSAFAFCNKITAIILSNTVTNIDGYSFDSLLFDTKLKTIYIPSSVTTLHDDAFKSQNGYPQDAYIYCEVDNKPVDWNNDWNKDFMFKFGIKRK